LYPYRYPPLSTVILPLHTVIGRELPLSLTDDEPASGFSHWPFLPQRSVGAGGLSFCVILRHPASTLFIFFQPLLGVIRRY
jgi:hypothetical protein